MLFLMHSKLLQIAQNESKSLPPWILNSTFQVINEMLLVNQHLFSPRTDRARCLRSGRWPGSATWSASAESWRRRRPTRGTPGSTHSAGRSTKRQVGPPASNDDTHSNSNLPVPFQLFRDSYKFVDSIRSDERKKLASELAEETDPEQIKKIKYLIQRYVSDKKIIFWPLRINKW